MDKLKKCNKCGIEKPLTKEYFHRNKNKKDGFVEMCKECRNKYAKDYREENKEKISNSRKEHYQRNKEKIKVKSNIYYRENKEKVKVSRAKYNKRNKEAISEQCKQYYMKNKEHIKKERRKYNKEHKEQKAKQDRIYRENNKDKINILLQRYHAKKKELDATLTVEQWEQIKGSFNNKCAYCGMTEEEHKNIFNQTLHQEHFIPLSKGGEYTHNNIIPACRSCNSSKQDKDFFEWYPQQKFYSKRREQKLLKHLRYEEGTQQLALVI